MEQDTYNYIRAAYYKKNEVVGTVIEFDPDKKIWIVDINGIKAIQPFNKNILAHRENPNNCIGKKMPFIICGINGNQVSVSHLEVFVRREEKQWNILEKGNALIGKVSYFNKFGAYIVVNYLTGFANFSSMNNIRIRKGDRVNVVVLEIDKERKKLKFEVTRVVKNNQRTSRLSNNGPSHNNAVFDEIETGQIINCNVYYINHRYLLLNYKGVSCKLASKEFTPAIFHNREFLVKPKDSVEVIVIGKGYHLIKHQKIQRLYVSAKKLEANRRDEEQKRLKELASQFVIGNSYPVKVTTFSNKIANIDAGIDIPAHILYEDLAGGRIPMDDKVFEGKEMDAIFLRYDNGKLYFSTKLLAEKPYDEQLFEADTDELIHSVGITANSFTAKVTEYRGRKSFNYLYADSIMNIDNNTDGFLLCDSYTGKQLYVLIPEEYADRFETNCYYSIHIKARESDFRKKIGNPFSFLLDTDRIDDVPQKLEDPYHKLVTQTFKKQKSPSQSESLAKLLVEVGDNMYDSKERMFFELLQNADDSSAGKGVEVNLESTDGYLILTHDGMPFNRPDFVSITAAARSSKPKTSKKTGYKGIGFKSVFKAYKVYLKTGGFFFKFDSENELYKDFDSFYFYVNDITDESKKAEFLEQFREEKKAFNNIECIPWQLLPEWVEEMPEELHNTEFSHRENVAIALAMTEATKQEYLSAIISVLSEPKFMLFLRNTNRINYRNGENNFCLAKDRNGEFVSLQSTNIDNPIKQEFIVRESEPLEVSNESFEKCGVDIKITKEYNSKTHKEDNMFRNGAGEKIDSIPPRISESCDTLISYAIPLDDNDNYKALSLSTTLFAYLPMTETRYPFPIYINADFIMKSSREGVQSENPWNFFLFYNIGKEYVKWIAKSASTTQSDYLTLLPSKYLDEKTVGMTKLSTYFNRGYRESLHSEAFILNDKAELVCMNKVMIDNTGLADVIDSDEYCFISGIKDRRLPFAGLNLSILKNKEVFDEIQYIKSLDECLLDASNLKYVRNWMTEATEEERTKAYKWLIANKKETLVKSLPLFEFSDKFYSINEVSASENLLFLTGELLWLKDIAEKLHVLCCEDDICNHTLCNYFLSDDFILDCNKKAIDVLISKSESSNSCLNIEDKALLFKVISKTCEEQKQNKKIGNWELFVNRDNTPKRINSMFLPAADFDANSLLSEYVISSDEYKAVSEGLDFYLMPIEKVYAQYIQPQWDSLLTRWETMCTAGNNNENKLSRLYAIVQFFYNATSNAYNLEQSKGNIKAVAPLNIGGQGNRYILSEGSFKKQCDVFYNKELASAEQYNVVKKLFSSTLPDFDFLHVFDNEPFKTQKSPLKNQIVNIEVQLAKDEIFALLGFCKSAKEDFFSNFKITEQNNLFQVSPLDKDEWVFYSSSAEFRAQVLESCKDAVILPPVFSAYSNMDGLATTEAIYEKLFASTIGDTAKMLKWLKFVNGETRTIKLMYANKFAEIIISPSLFVEGSDLTLLFKMFAELCDEDGFISALRNQIKIKETDTTAIALIEISMQGTVSISKSVFDMDSLLPDDNHSIQKISANIVSEMRLRGISDTFLNGLFNLNQQITPAEVFKKLNTNRVLINKEQFAFMLKYAFANNISQASFLIKNKANDSINVTNSKLVVCDASFIEEAHILSPDYVGFLDYLDDNEKKKLPFGVQIYDSGNMLAFVKQVLSREEKFDLLNFLFKKWDKAHRLMNDTELYDVKNALCVASPKLIWASEVYLLENEHLPKDLLDWIATNKDEHKLFAVTELGINDESCDAISVRKYLHGDITEPKVNNISETIQQQTSSWIKSKGMILKTGQFVFIKSILSEDYYSISVDISKLSEYCKEENVIFRFGNYTVYNCHDSIPYNVMLTKNDNYICHTFLEGDVWLSGKNIYINEQCIDMGDAILELTNKNLLDAKDYLLYAQTPKDKQYSASLEGGMDNDMDEKRRIARSSLAKQEAETWLKEHGYTIPDGIGDYSDFIVRDKNGKIYPVVVKSFSGNLFINPNEWLQLVKPNSRLILYRGHGKISVITHQQLLKFKEFLYLRILSSNFDEDNDVLNDRIEDISRCLRYFKRTHIVIDDISTSQFKDSISLDDIGLYRSSGNVVDQSNDLEDIV